MKIRLSLEFKINRRRTPEPQPDPEEQFEHRDNDGTMVIHQDQPRYIGFTPVNDDQEDRT